jgi:glycosyltransferase involved in cell wall biosynthesis
MKKLFLLFHGRFPSEKAAALFAGKSAEAFADEGYKVAVLVPDRSDREMEDPFKYYSLKDNFDVMYLSVIDFFKYKKLFFWTFLISYISFSFSSCMHVAKNSGKDDIIYSNEILPLFLISFIRKNCFYEMHDFPESKVRLFGMFLRRMKWILIHNHWKMEMTKNLFPMIDQEKFLYEQNAVDIRAFDLDISKEEARKKLSLPLDRKIAVYTGHLYGWKGAYVLGEAAQKLSDEFLVVFVGGTSRDVEEFKNRFGNEKRIDIVGFRHHEEIPLWQKAADVLVLPNTAKQKISAYYTSPMKLYEYMASSRPVVASDIPSIREIVNESSAVLVEPDNPEALAYAIESTLMAPKISEELARSAYASVLEHTWDKRAKRIIDFMHV